MSTESSDLLSDDWQYFELYPVELVETRPGAGWRQTFEKLQQHKYDSSRLRAVSIIMSPPPYGRRQ